MNLLLMFFGLILQPPLQKLTQQHQTYRHEQELNEVISDIRFQYLDISTFGKDGEVLDVFGNPMDHDWFLSQGESREKFFNHHIAKELVLVDRLPSQTLSTKKNAQKATLIHLTGVSEYPFPITIIAKGLHGEFLERFLVKMNEGTTLTLGLTSLTGVYGLEFYSAEPFVIGWENMLTNFGGTYQSKNPTLDLYDSEAFASIERIVDNCTDHRHVISISNKNCATNECPSSDTCCCTAFARYDTFRDAATNRMGLAILWPNRNTIHHQPLLNHPAYKGSLCTDDKNEIKAYTTRTSDATVYIHEWDNLWNVIWNTANNLTGDVTCKIGCSGGKWTYTKNEMPLPGDGCYRTGER